MKSPKLDFARDVLIGEDHWDVPVRVSPEAYQEFIRQVDEGLAKLVARWIHAAAPAASQPRRRR